MSSFPTDQVAVTLTGEEWTTITGGLSRHGSRFYRQATAKLRERLLAASERGTERAAGNGFPEKSPERTIFDTIPAKAKRTFKDVNMGFINSQSAKSSCRVETAKRL